MSKFNARQAIPRRRATGPVSSVRTTQVPTGRTGEGAPGYARDAKSELFMLAVTNMVSENTFYEAAQARDLRFETLVHEVAVADYTWFCGFLNWLRNDANMRTASVVAAVEGANAMAEAGVGGGRYLFNSLARADEPGEALAYWLGHYGRPIPKPIKRGIADAAARLYDEFAFLKWDSERSDVRFADVIELTRPSPAKVAQNQLFRYILDARHGHNAITDERVHASYLPLTVRQIEWRRNAEKTPLPLAGLLDPEHIRGAGLTWEDVMSALGDKVDKAKLWEALIPSMGYMALLRNLRNFDQAGISREAVRRVVDRLEDPEQVRRSRQFPLRFLSAYREVPSLNWGGALEAALDLSTPNIPALPGRSLILVDMSGSMDGRLSARSSVSRRNAAAVFAVAYAKKNPAGTDLVQFGTNAAKVTFSVGDSALLIATTKFRGMGGTNTQAATRQFYAGHDRVIILTDEQSHDGDPGAVVPANVPVYNWNLAGYRYGQTPVGGPNRHAFAGLNDAAFKIVPLLERGENAPWPWEIVPERERRNFSDADAS
jgi:hypothetical protein